MADLELTRLFGGVYAGRRVLVTGHTGFKGSWLALWLQTLGAKVVGLALPPPTEPSHARLLKLAIPEYEIDLREPERVRAALAEIQPELIFHLAAQSLVRASYQDPVTTFGSNVMGLVHLLDALRSSPATRVLINTTSDKCYAPQHPGSGPQGAYREDDRLGGHDPYSTSKACAELVTASWRASFYGATPNPAVALATVRAGNVMGGGDWAEDRLIPDLIRAAQSQQACALRHPQAVRPWQHVLEPLSGYLRLGQHLLTEGAAAAGSWNFGPPADELATVADLAACVARHWPGMRWHTPPGVHPHEAAMLRLDAGHAATSLDWRPVWSVNTALEHTVAWYRAWYDTHTVRSLTDLQQYVRDAQAQGLAWTR